MKKRLIALSTVGIVSTLLIGSAHGGSRWTWTVNIYNVAADGVLSDVRSTEDDIQDIGCYLSAYSTSSVPTVNCWVTDSAGTHKSCTAANAAMATTVASLQGNSYLYFSWDTSGNCTRVFVQNDSALSPLQP